MTQNNQLNGDYFGVDGTMHGNLHLSIDGTTITYSTKDRYGKCSTAIDKIPTNAVIYPNGNILRQVDQKNLFGNGTTRLVESIRLRGNTLYRSHHQDPWFIGPFGGVWGGHVKTFTYTKLIKK